MNKLISNLAQNWTKTCQINKDKFPIMKDKKTMTTFQNKEFSALFRRLMLSVICFYLVCYHRFTNFINWKEKIVKSHISFNYRCCSVVIFESHCKPEKQRFILPCFASRVYEAALLWLQPSAEIISSLTLHESFVVC